MELVINNSGDKENTLLHLADPPGRDAAADRGVRGGGAAAGGGERGEEGEGSIGHLGGGG